MDRKYVGEIVFNHPEKRLELNDIVHPIVRDNGRRKAIIS